ncbi:ATP-binding cassette subfamily C protein [Paenibacillus phyllosphaerae]|uniref:ATP-binding cassette subfamily C protein n=1 Tax=Paenibacillus phyllosphaerae TaxID=274593 RepID=A0A7W5FKZ1_9BACL|nr:ABC transporter ATP-binding protein [Paenibacillus phyllosphaerae]MBB3108553.1 ATP-binding cassette subfamily C protein [Paenibacillus phyllosphaerae]
MKELLIFLKRMHHVSGVKLYFNFFGMMLISSLEGIAIFLLAPLLSITGITNMQTASIPYITQVTDWIKQIPGNYQLLGILLLYVALVVAQAVIQRNQTILNSQIQQAFIKQLRLDTYRELLQANWTLFLRTRKSDINHILNTELVRIISGTSMALKLATTFIFTIVQIAFAMFISPSLTVFVIICGIGLALFSKRYRKRAQVLGKETTELSKSYIAGITDHFNGIKDIKTNMLEQQHYHWFRQICIQLERNFNQFARLQTTSQLFYKVTSAFIIGLFVFLSFEVFKVQGGELLLIILIFSRLWPKFTGIQSSLEQIIQSLPAFKSLVELQQECREARELESLELSNYEQPLRIRHDIACQHLSYRYEGSASAYALHDINLTIPVNSTTAIVGKSGAGKSTLIDMLIGLIRPESGMVTFDGRQLNDQERIALRQSVSYVSQDPFLFHASIKDNMRMAQPDATEAQMWEALEFSASAEFIRKLPQGLDTIIGDRGIRLSGGERQRLVLARAILRKPSILVLDEATSALDSENEAKIQRALDQLKGSMTIIIIAHRLSTIRDADQVIVLEGGRIIQQGGYVQLSKETKGEFSRLLSYQFGVNA